MYPSVHERPKGSCRKLKNACQIYGEESKIDTKWFNYLLGNILFIEETCRKGKKLSFFEHTMFGTERNLPSIL